MSDRPSSVAAVLPMPDILPLVLQHLAGDLASLCACALVDRDSNRAASAVLYRDIVFSPPWTATLDLNEAHRYSVSSRTTMVCYWRETHHYQTMAQILATWDHTPVRNTPSSCRLCKDRRNWGYGRFERRKGQFESN